MALSPPSTRQMIAVGEGCLFLRIDRHASTAPARSSRAMGKCTMITCIRPSVCIHGEETAAATTIAAAGKLISRRNAS